MSKRIHGELFLFMRRKGPHENLHELTDARKLRPELKHEHRSMNEQYLQSTMTDNLKCYIHQFAGTPRNSLLSTVN